MTDKNDATPQADAPWWVAWLDTLPDGLNLAIDPTGGTDGGRILKLDLIAPHSSPAFPGARLTASPKEAAEFFAALYGSATAPAAVSSILRAVPAVPKSERFLLALANAGPRGLHTKALTRACGVKGGRALPAIAKAARGLLSERAPGCNPSAALTCNATSGEQSIWRLDPQVARAAGLPAVA